jgi:3-oxoacyl-[acyl-carrier-protein] synthase-3
MIGIKSIASYVPADGIDNYAQGAKFAKDEEFIIRKIGSAFLPRKEAAQETSDLCVEAVNALFANNPDLKRESIDALIVVTQNGDEEGLPHTAAIVQDKLGLPTHVAAFDISLGCSGYVYGIYAMKGFMEATGLKNGLLVTADPYSKIVDPEDRNTTMLFGDAATATWMGEDAPWLLGKAKFGTDGSGAPHLKVSDGVFFMNGRQVFNFALLKVPAHCMSCSTSLTSRLTRLMPSAFTRAVRRLSTPWRVALKMHRWTSSSRTWSRPATPCRRAFRCCWKSM